jgi:hypothetical protein
VDRHPREPADQDGHAGDPQDVPETGDHADEGRRLGHHLGDGDRDGPALAAAQRLLPVHDDQGGQERDGHREGDHADLADRPSDTAVRNGCAMYTPMRIRPP